MDTTLRAIPLPSPLRKKMENTQEISLNINYPWSQLAKQELSEGLVLCKLKPHHTMNFTQIGNIGKEYTKPQ